MAIRSRDAKVHEYLQTVRHVKMLDGVEVSESKTQKDELILEGNDIDNVSQSGAQFYFLVHQSVLTYDHSCFHPR